jgi:hypothetical protein
VQGGEEVIELVLSWLVTTTMIFAVVIGDERDLDEVQAERAWPATSRDAAIVAFGILAVPIHFARTRGDFRSLRGALGVLYGLVLGLGCAIGLAIIASVLLGAALGTLFEDGAHPR